MSNHDTVEGYVSNIQRLSVHDGPGIRTTVFFLGCPLRCEWCQNPETMDTNPQLMFNASKCVKCGECALVCNERAQNLEKNQLNIHSWDNCCHCGKCVSVCAYKANEMSGNIFSAEKLLLEILSDKTFYQESGGGVTFSGGEPTYQFQFLSKILDLCRQNDIHTAVDTCGLVSWEKLSIILNKVDLFLYDIKLIDQEKHYQLTGAKNDIILENAKKLSESHNAMIVRVPLIPGINDGFEEFSKIVNFVKQLKSLEIIHLMPFHQFGASKYNLINLPYKFKNTDESNQTNVDNCKQIALDAGLQVNIGGSGTFGGKSNLKKKSEPFYICKN